MGIMNNLKLSDESSSPLIYPRDISKDFKDLPDMKNYQDKKDIDFNSLIKGLSSSNFDSVDCDDFPSQEQQPQSPSSKAMTNTTAAIANTNTNTNTNNANNRRSSITDVDSFNPEWNHQDHCFSSDNNNSNTNNNNNNNFNNYYNNNIGKTNVNANVNNNAPTSPINKKAAEASSSSSAQNNNTIGSNTSSPINERPPPNRKGKNVVQNDSLDSQENELFSSDGVEDNNEISNYLAKARDMVNEKDYSWEYLSKTETNISVMESQFNKYAEAIEYLLKINKDNNITNSKGMSRQIEIYLKKAEYLKEKIKRLKGSSDDQNQNQMNRSFPNVNEKNISSHSLHHTSSADSLESPSTATPWEKDENAPLCNDCKTRFSLFNRRHHCRNCGKVFCSRCSDFQFRLQKGAMPERVCKNCYKNLRKARLKSTEDGNSNTNINTNSITNLPPPPAYEESPMNSSSDDELIECPVCGKPLTLYGSDQNNIENHLKTCLDQVNTDNKVKLGNRFELQTLQHDLGSECPICFEEFLKGQTIARIDCLCIFHKDCIDKWYEYRKCDGICPIHSMDD